MRDILVFLAIFLPLPVVLARPFLGILLWHWFSLMNPHRFAWGFAYTFPFAVAIGATTLAAWLFSREPKHVPWRAPMILLVLLWAWTCLTTLTAMSPDLAFEKWEQTSKILLMTVVTAAMLTTANRLRMLVWLTVVSLGFYGVKGGLFALATGGQHRVFGPPDTFMTDNNAIALALGMALPLIAYLAETEAKKWVRWGLVAAFGLTTIAVLFTFSRGGLLGLAIVLVGLWWRTKQRIAWAALGVLSLGTLFALAPEKWIDRTASIEEYQTDSSAQSRFEMWGMAVRIAADEPITGGGFRVFKEPAIYPLYNPQAELVRDVHSMYFEVLGEHGFVGLALFVLIGAATILTGNRIRANTKGRPELAWAHRLAAMLQISIAGYAVSGAFLTLGFFDLSFLLVALMVGLRMTVAAETNLGKAVAAAPKAMRPHAQRAGTPPMAAADLPHNSTWPPGRSR
jgi:probable O-glycosylation ligase (exosortase A-associated)